MASGRKMEINAMMKGKSSAFANKNKNLNMPREPLNSQQKLK